MKRTGFAKILALCIVLVTVLGVLPLVMAADDCDNNSLQVEILDNGYSTDFRPGPDYLIPGDPVEIRIWSDDSTPDGLEDVFDILIFEENHPVPVVFADKVGHFNDVVLDGNGEAVVSYELTKSLADGTYNVYVGPDDWYDNSGVPFLGEYWDMTQFHIQLYTIQATTDRTGYVPGDDVTVFYSVVSIRDGSLITEDAYDGSSFDGQWNVESGDGKTTDGPTSFSDSSGNFEFQIFPQGSVTSEYHIYIYFNGTYGSTREQMTQLEGNVPWPDDFTVGGLGLTVDLDRAPPEYQINSVVKVTILATAAGSGEPDADVKIEVLEGTGVSASKISGYGGTFQSDASGYVIYAFTVEAGDFDDDETYTVRVNVSKHLKATEDDEIFDVLAGGRVISVRMMFDKEVYASGDTISIDVTTSLPEGASDVSAYSYEVRLSNFNGPIIWMESSESNFFNYEVRDSFDGRLYFIVNVYNPDGDSGRDQEMKNVHHAILLINAEPEEYEPGDTITAEFELTSNRLAGINDRSFFYVVKDSDNDVVREGEVVTSEDTGSFEFLVPDVASDEYTFTIYANILIVVGNNEYMVWVSASDVCELTSGYDIEISVDNPSYAPGDRVAIHYSITARGDEGFPDKFVFSYGMSNGPMYTWQSDSPSGDIYYEIPSGVNEGDVLFQVYAEDGDRNAIGYAYEMLHIQEGASALEWVRPLDVPLFSWMLLLFIILAIIFLMMFRRPKAPAPEKAPAEAAPEPAPVEEELAPEEASPLAINCKSCGAEIEITTSKRPIEVMCPSCGETEMVE